MTLLEGAAALLALLLVVLSVMVVGVVPVVVLQLVLETVTLQLLEGLGLWSHTSPE